MKTRLVLTTAVGLVFATAAIAQSPKESTRESTQSPTTQTQTPTTPQKAPDASTNQTPSSNATAPAAPGPSQAQTTPSASSQPGGTSAPAQAQTGAPPASTNQAQQAPATGTPTNQAQQAPSSSQTTAQQPSQNTTAQQPSTQQPSQSTTAQPAQPANPPSNTAQSSSTSVNAAVNINDQQRTRVSQSIARLNVQPVTNVNFSLSVGTAVPRDVRLQTLPAEVVEVVPQYRGYSFFVVRDEIVIVEPSTYKIVTVLPRSGGSTAAAPARTQSKASFTDKDRDVVRKHVKARTTERQTTGSTAKVVIRRGERLPEAVEVEEFPETVYRDAPALRDYRYLHRENRTYIVDPGERTVIDEFD